MQPSEWQPPSETQQIKRSLRLLAVATLFHTVLDPAITYFVVIHFGVGFELNPVLRPWLQAGLFPFIIVHLPVYILSVGGGLAFRRLLQHASGREQVAIYYLSVVGFGGLVCWGVVLVMNNLWVLWAGI